MELDLVANTLSRGMLLWFVLLSGVVLYKLLTGQINIRGLFQSNLRPTTSSINPERVQSLLVFGAVLGGYAFVVLDVGPIVGEDGKLSLPEAPEALIAVLAGSNGVYLAGKLLRT